MSALQPAVTDEEKELLSMYDAIKQYERVAHRLQQDAARAKLAARAAAFDAEKVSSSPKKKKQKRNVMTDTNNIRVHSDNSAFEDGEPEEPDSEDSENDGKAESMHQRREAKIAELRDQVEQTKKLQDQKSQEEEELREKLLETADDLFLDNAPTLKRKKRNEDAAADANQPSSLIASITAASTPPHDFSKSLGLTATTGTIVFPKTVTTTAELPQPPWSPPAGVYSPNDGAFVVTLPNFDVNTTVNGRGNNTVAIKLAAPADSKRFSINLCAPNHDSFNSVLFHFNPRQHERGGQLVVNDKQDGVWGQAIVIPLSQVPLLFGAGGRTSMVRIQIHDEGFDIFVENQHCARLEHRQDLSAADHLVLQFPSTDDYGSPESWTAYKVCIVLYSIGMFREV
jgi:hypothetical protein